MLYQITVLVAAKGAQKLPNINGAEDLKKALQKLRSLLPSKLLVSQKRHSINLLLVSFLQ